MNIEQKLSDFIEIDFVEFKSKTTFNWCWHTKFYDNDEDGCNVPEFDCGIFRVMVEHQNPDKMYLGFAYCKVLHSENNTFIPEWYLYNTSLGVFNNPKPVIMQIAFFQELVTTE